MDIDNLDIQDVKVESLSDDELDKAIKQNIGVVDEEKGEDKTPAGSSPEKKSDEDTSPPSQGEEKGEGKTPDNTEDELKDVPFHKHPRFQKLIQTKKELEEKNKQYEERLQKLENPMTEVKLLPIPIWFAGDENDWQLYCQEQNNREKMITSNIIEKIKSEEQSNQDQIKKMERWVDDEIEKLEDDPETKPFKRNELLKIMNEYKPTDENGNLDFKKGYDLLGKFNEHKPIIDDKKKEGKKDLKNLVSSDNLSGGSENEGKLVTADDIRTKSFGQLISRIE